MNQKRETAKIYVFPVKNGANVGMPSNEAKWQAELAALGATHAAIGSSWYHDDAVKASTRPDRR
ncbi:DUF2735 domain-containing protein [Xanthobacter autotrophicus]|uniref:DUF2735 domain-containing protein n=1 Tax=Xanthobacter sp. AM33 TaxID=3380644 RepID=UPI0024AB2478|nr:DUF2735 domain-containing protein [Xanthobacter autotrophicus]